MVNEVMQEAGLPGVAQLVGSQLEQAWCCPACTEANWEMGRRMSSATHEFAQRQSDVQHQCHIHTLSHVNMHKTSARATAVFRGA